MFTTEDMQEYDYNMAQYDAIQGVYDAERFVSENDMERADCIHEHGEYVESGTQTVYGYMVGSVYECADCGETVEV